jgi:ribosomal protein L29
MKYNAIKKLSADEMMKALAENRSKVRAFRTAMAGGRSGNLREGKNARRTVARLLTAIKSSSN